MSKLVFHWLPFPEADGEHFHDYAHIIVPLVGDVIVTLNNLEYIMTTNHLFFIPPNVPHFCQRSNTVFSMDIPTSMINPQHLEILSQCLFVPLNHQMATVIMLIKQELIDKTHGDSTRYLYYYLYDKLVAQYQYKSVQYIHEHYNEPISIHELADLECYNVTYFTDWFKKQTGNTPSNYVRNLRMDKARELLTSTNFRIIDIAIQVGYSNNASFSKAFKELFDCSPADYRKNAIDAIHNAKDSHSN